MSTPLPYRQLQTQLSQWIKPRDKRHLLTFAENLAAILQSESGCLSHWLDYLSHRNCQARSHMARLSYFVHNPQITPDIFYVPILKRFLSAWEGQSLSLTLDTSMFWDEYCLIEVCCVWGGRSFPLAQKVMKHGSATVACQDYLPVLEATLAVLPPNCEVTLLADRGFEHGDLIRWLQAQQWFWCIRAKSDLQIHLRDGRTCAVAQLIPPTEQASLFREVTILGDISCHLATASPSIAQESWAVLSNLPPSIQTFALYGQRFGGIEPHFKDYKSAAFGISRSHLRDADALSRLLLLLSVATLLSLSLAVTFLQHQSLARLDWHGHRGLSFLQLGLRALQRLCYLREPIPLFSPLPLLRPRPACASLTKRNLLSTRIEFSKIMTY